MDLGDSDTQCDEMFLNDLIIAYKTCAKETNDSVTVDRLAQKYLETHSNEEYRKNLKGIGLKTYLVKSDHFAVTQNIVTITEGNHVHVELIIIMFVVGNNTKQDEKVSQSEEQSSIKKSSACLNIRVHIEYGKDGFPIRIKTNDFDQFYDKIVSTINSKIPGFKSHCMQFQCGKKWYGFNQSTGFDALCLDEDDPEITIQVTPILSEPQHTGK